jgi:hypothetical protein
MLLSRPITVCEPEASPTEKATLELMRQGSAGVSPAAQLVALALVACVLEGAGRKWLLTAGDVWLDGLFYFSKDLILALGVLLIPPSRTRACPQLVGLWDALAVTAGITLAAAAVNLSGSPIVGAILSLRSVLLLPAFALALARRLRSYKDIELIVNIVGVLAIANAVLGTLQYYLPQDHFLNQQVAGGISVVDVGRVRAIGTFSYITGLADMALAASWAGCVLLSAPPIRKYAYVVTAAALICPLAALSRTGLVASLGLLISVLVLSKGGLRAALPLVALFIAIGWFLSSKDEQQGKPSGILEGIARRHQNADSFEDRAGSILGDIPRAATHVPLGEGLGAGQVASRVTQEGALREMPRFEFEPGRIIYEIGLFGWAGVLMFRCWVVGVLWKSLGAAQGSSPFGNVRKASLAALALFFATNTVFDHIASFFAWIVAATALATIEMEWRRRLETAEKALVL